MTNKFAPQYDELPYQFRAPLWVWKSDKGGGWHFVSLPEKLADEIILFHGQAKNSWGSIKVKGLIGKTGFETSIFPDKKNHGFLLPVKADIRKAEGLKEGDEVGVSLLIKRGSLPV